MLWTGRLINYHSISSRARHLPLLQNVQTGSGVHPPSYTLATGESFPRAKQPTYEGDQSPSPSAVRMSEAVPSLPHMPLWHAEG